MVLDQHVRSENERVGREAAQRLRDEHALGLAPLENLATFAEETLGFDVLITAMPPGVDALTAADDARNRTLIAVAATDNNERQRFSLAHELGHAVLGDLAETSDVHDANEETEDRAHCFARHLLIPIAGIELRFSEMEVTRENLTERGLSALVQHFGVSAHVAARQLRLAGWIDDARLGAWKVHQSAHLAALYGWDAERRARVVESSNPRTPQRLAARAVQAYIAGLIPLQSLASIRQDPDLKTTEEWLEESGITVDQPVSAESTPIEVAEF